MQTDAPHGAAVYKRIVLKLSGESLSGPQESGIHAETIQGIAKEVNEINGLGVQVAIMVGGGNIFRGTRQKASLDRSRHRRLHGHAGHRDQRLGAAGRARKGGLPHAIDERHRDARGGGAFYSPPRDAPSGERPRGDFRGGHRQSLFFHGHGRRIARDGNQGAGDSESHARGRHLRRRSGESAEREILRTHHVPGRAAKRAFGDGFHRDLALHGQQDAHRHLQHERAGKPQTRCDGRASGLGGYGA